MRNLIPVMFNDEAALRAVIPRKNLARRARLAGALGNILARYAEYSANTGELFAINASPFVEPLVEDCKSLYSETNELAALKKAISDSQHPLTRSYCQYCMLGEPGGLDHYASKGRFPEFSMFSLNLVPCCGRCNLDKGEGWAAKGYRHFINFYYDTFIQHPILHAKLQFQINGDMALVFVLRDHPDVTPNQLSIMKSHFDELDLFQRHSERAAAVIAEARNMIRRLDMRIGQINDILQADADAKAEDFGQNYWQAAVYRCLATSGRFVEECLGNGWLPRARSEVAHLLALPVSAATNDRLRALVETRAWSWV
jgi:hypothetical protein